MKVFALSTGNKCVCINAATMALIDAGVPMKDFVCACSAGYIEDTPLLGQTEVALYVCKHLYYSLYVCCLT